MPGRILSAVRAQHDSQDDGDQGQGLVSRDRFAGHDRDRPGDAPLCRADRRHDSDVLPFQGQVHEAHSDELSEPAGDQPQPHTAPEIGHRRQQERQGDHCQADGHDPSESHRRANAASRSRRQHQTKSPCECRTTASKDRRHTNLPRDQEKAVIDAIAEFGTCPGLPYELEIEAASKVVEAVPGIDMVRFSNSGSEVVGTAVRLARAYTKRRLIIRFEGHYHGWQDTVYWSNHVDPSVAGPPEAPRPVAMGPGVPRELEDTIIVLSWNDPESVERVMRERGDEIAAIITEPVVFNTGCIAP
jgi:hypothetical protein